MLKFGSSSVPFPTISYKLSISSKSLGLGFSREVLQSGTESIVLWLCSGHIFCPGPTSFPAVLPPPLPPPAPLPSPISLGLSAEEELGLGALCVMQQEESEEVFVRPM